MNFRSLLTRQMGLICAGLLCAFCSFAENRPPNIIYILADDLGYNDLGCYGQKLIQTPEIDAMAKEGIRFTQHYTGAPVCAPARAVLMTGMHTGHTTVRGNSQNPDGEGQMPLPKDEMTFAKLLQNNGYATAFYGKWGLGNVGTIGDPLKRGFDTYCGYLDQVLAHNAFPEFLIEDGEKIMLDNEVAYLSEDAWHKGLGSVSTEKYTFSQEIFIEKALSYIDAHQDEPFFLYLPVIIPHDNGEAPVGERMEVPHDGDYAVTSWSSDAKSYAAAISWLDRDVGRILDRLRELGIAENTLVVFTSDNGPVNKASGYTEHFDSNGKLRGYKRDLYEGGIRVPFIAWWPGTIEAGIESPHISAFWDFFPTVCDLAGIETPDEVDGISMLPALIGEDQPAHDYLYWEFPITWEGNGNGYQVAIRQGKWKGIRVDLLNNPEAPVQLYNLDEDPSESDDLASRYPEKAEELKMLMEASHEPSPFFPSP